MVNYYLVNTNSTYLGAETKIRMLENNCILAEYGPKTQIDKIQNGDIVFIYENNEGIIAYGVADGKAVPQDYKKKNDKEEHIMKLMEFNHKITPIKPSTINEIARKFAITKTKLFYARTVTPLNSLIGEELLKLVSGKDKLKK